MSQKALLPEAPLLPSDFSRTPKRGLASFRSGNTCRRRRTSQGVTKLMICRSIFPPAAVFLGRLAAFQISGSSLACSARHIFRLGRLGAQTAGSDQYEGDGAGRKRKKGKKGHSVTRGDHYWGLYHCDGAIQQLQIGGPGPRRFLSVCAPGTNRLTLILSPM